MPALSCLRPRGSTGQFGSSLASENKTEWAVIRLRSGSHPLIPWPDDSLVKTGPLLLSFQTPALTVGTAPQVWRDMSMRRFLIVANQTLSGEHLQHKVADCIADGPCRFHVVVPATRNANNKLVWTEGESTALARQRLDDAIERLRGIGADVDGEVGDQQPLMAISDAVLAHDFDEIILSTLPPGASRWLAQDLPRRVRRTFPLPVSHIVAPAQQVLAPVKQVSPMPNEALPLWP
jgi:hypothetical protein